MGGSLGGPGTARPVLPAGRVNAPRRSLGHRSLEPKVCGPGPWYGGPKSRPRRNAEPDRLAAGHLHRHRAATSRRCQPTEPCSGGPRRPRHSPPAKAAPVGQQESGGRTAKRAYSSGKLSQYLGNRGAAAYLTTRRAPQHPAGCRRPAPVLGGSACPHPPGRRVVPGRPPEYRPPPPPLVGTRRVPGPRSRDPNVPAGAVVGALGGGRGGLRGPPRRSPCPPAGPRCRDGRVCVPPRRSGGFRGRGGCPGEQSPLRLTLPVGTPWPLHAGASNRVLLAFLPPPQREEILRQPLRRITPRTITDPARLRRELDRVRRRGFAYSVGELTPGVAAVAVPVLAQGRLLGGLTVAGPEARLTPGRVPGIVRRLQAAAKALARDLLGTSTKPSEGVVV